MPVPLLLKPTDNYIVHLEVFEGPMDLLLHLIEREELPITAVSLAQVTKQYLDHLERLEQLKPDGIAEFLVMAARLLYIKSVALLPQVESEEEEEEEDPGEALARQLREYKRFKEKAGFLKDLEASGRKGYVRLAPPPSFEKRLDPEGLDVQLLMEAVYEVLSELDEPPRPVHSIAPLLITVEGRMDTLLTFVPQVGAVVQFKRFLGQSRTQVEVIVSLLAVLELIKQNEIRVEQEQLFGDILIERLPAPEPDTLAEPESY